MSPNQTRNAEGGTRNRADRLRVLNAPQRVAIELDAKGLPVMVMLGKRAAGNVQRGVEAVGEVWRIDDEWWRQPISRRYVEVVFEGGGRAVLFADLITGEWWMQKP